MNLKEIIETKLKNISPNQFKKNGRLHLNSWGENILFAERNQHGVIVVLLDSDGMHQSENLFKWTERSGRISMASSRPYKEAEKVADFDKVYFDWLISLDCYLKQVHAAMLERGDCFADRRNENFSRCLPALRAELVKLNSETGVNRRLFGSKPKAVAAVLAGEVLGCSWDSADFEAQLVGATWGKR